MSPLWPITIAATTAPTPKSVGQLRARRRHGGGDAAAARFELGVEADEVIEVLQRHVLACGLERRRPARRSRAFRLLGGCAAGWASRPATSSASRAWSRHAVRFRARERSSKRLANSRRTSCVLGAAHPGDVGVAHRGDGDRAGVVGVVLVRPARAQQAHPGGQGGGHVEDVLARGEELLGHAGSPTRRPIRPPSAAPGTAPPTPAARRPGQPRPGPSGGPVRPRRRR